MTHFKYITDHLLRAWVQSWTYNFKLWTDLMTNNYEAYANPYGESPERECYEWFCHPSVWMRRIAKTSLNLFIR